MWCDQRQQKNQLLAENRELYKLSRREISFLYHNDKNQQGKSNKSLLWNGCKNMQHSMTMMSIYLWLLRTYLLSFVSISSLWTKKNEGKHFSPKKTTRSWNTNHHIPFYCLFPTSSAHSARCNPIKIEPSLSLSNSKYSHKMVRPLTRLLFSSKGKKERNEKKKKKKEKREKRSIWVRSAYQTIIKTKFNWKNCQNRSFLSLDGLIHPFFKNFCFETIL